MNTGVVPNSSVGLIFVCKTKHERLTNMICRAANAMLHPDVRWILRSEL